MEAADVLLFGEPDSERTVRWAEVLIEALQTSERWSVESCDRLREHLYGCGAPSGASLKNRALGPASLERGQDLPGERGGWGGRRRTGLCVGFRRGTRAPAD